MRNIVIGRYNGSILPRGSQNFCVYKVFNLFIYSKLGRVNFFSFGGVFELFFEGIDFLLQNPDPVL